MRTGRPEWVSILHCVRQQALYFCMGFMLVSMLSCFILTGHPVKCDASYQAFLLQFRLSSPPFLQWHLNCVTVSVLGWWNSIVSIVTHWTVWFDSQWGQGIFSSQKSLQTGFRAHPASFNGYWGSSWV